MRTRLFEYTCPYCGRKIYFTSRGETRLIDSKIWSDNAINGNFIPFPLNFLKCDKCSKYFFRTSEENIIYNYAYTDLEPAKRGNGAKWDYDDVKAALLQFEKEGFPNSNIEFDTRFKFLQKYNTEFLRPFIPRSSREDIIAKEMKRRKPTEEDNEMFRNNVIEINKSQAYADSQIHTIIRAEFLREIGSFEQAEQLLLSITRPEDDDISYYIAHIISKVQKKESKVFPLNTFNYNLAEFEWSRKYLWKQQL